MTTDYRFHLPELARELMLEAYKLEAENITAKVISREQIVKEWLESAIDNLTFVEEPPTEPKPKPPRTHIFSTLDGLVENMEVDYVVAQMLKWILEQWRNS